MKIRFLTYIFIPLLAHPLWGFTQAFQELASAEGMLTSLFSDMMKEETDESRLEKGIHFFEAFQKVLEMDDSFHYPFDSLPVISKVVSPDNLFRIYTWNLPLTDGSNRFYGLIQIPGTAHEPDTIIILHDRSGQMKDPEEDSLTPSRWYGAIYYQIIPEKTWSGKTVYTLLGWHRENFLVSSRVIEILSVSARGEVVFGKSIFCHTGKDSVKRMIFRYAAKASMILRYEEQYIIKSKRWNARKRTFEYIREKQFLIVCDRLIPTDPQLEGQHEYYIPSGEVMDGFVFSEGCWHFIENVDVRNPTSN